MSGDYKLSITDHLNCYLVQNGLKPSYEFSLLPVGKIKVELTRIIGGVESIVYSIDREAIAKCSEDMKRSGLCVKEELKLKKRNCTIEGKPSVYYQEEFSIMAAKTAEALERLCNAKTDKEQGAALGFPDEAIEGFHKIVNGVFNNGTALWVNIAKAKRAGLEPPLWLAYLSYVPEKHDLVNEEVSETSRRLGITYMQYVRRFNPPLAAAVEYEFLNHPLPDSWTLLPEGFYEIKKD